MAESSMTSQEAVEITVSMEISTREIQGVEWMCKSMHEEKYVPAAQGASRVVAEMGHSE